MADNLIDLVGFGRKLLTNSDYLKRVKLNAKMNEISDDHTLFDSGTARGYADYSFLND